jgi:hypothetical protein
MDLPIQLISTDFDGTLHAEFESPPVPPQLEELIADLQQRGARWVINTGRDLPSLMEAMARARLVIKPDFLALVEREIYVHDGAQYLPLEEWNIQCAADHSALFARVREDLPGLIRRLGDSFDASIYADAYSPLCIIGRNNRETDQMQEILESYCAQIPGLTVVRNDIYARFSHAAYNKGTVLERIARLLGVSSEQTFAAGDHLNDLPMLSHEFAAHLTAPANAIPAVKDAVRRQGGFVAEEPYGWGVAGGLRYFLGDND